MTKSLFILILCVIVPFLFSSCTQVIVTKTITMTVLPAVSGVSVKVNEKDTMIDWNESTVLLFDHYAIYGIRSTALTLPGISNADGYKAEPIQEINDISTCNYSFSNKYPGKPDFEYYSVTVIDKHGIESEIKMVQPEYTKVE
jgi:hypothetical protein